MDHPEHNVFYFVLNSKPNHTTNYRLESGDTLGSKSLLDPDNNVGSFNGRNMHTPTFFIGKHPHWLKAYVLVKFKFINLRTRVRTEISRQATDFLDSFQTSKWGRCWGTPYAQVDKVEDSHENRWLLRIPKALRMTSSNEIWESALRPVTPACMAHMMTPACTAYMMTPASRLTRWFLCARFEWCRLFFVQLTWGLLHERFIKNPHPNRHLLCKFHMKHNFEPFPAL